METKKRLLKRIAELQDELNAVREENNKLKASQKELDKLIEFYQNGIQNYKAARNQYLDLSAKIKEERKKYRNEINKLLARLKKDAK